VKSDKKGPLSGYQSFYFYFFLFLLFFFPYLVVPNLTGRTSRTGPPARPALWPELTAGGLSPLLPASPRPEVLAPAPSRSTPEGSRARPPRDLAGARRQRPATVPHMRPIPWLDRKPVARDCRARPWPELALALPGGARALARDRRWSPEFARDCLGGARPGWLGSGMSCGSVRRAASRHLGARSRGGASGRAM
jgi:hypothetical protein